MVSDQTNHVLSKILQQLESPHIARKDGADVHICTGLALHYSQALMI